jgi:TP901 family phage tail tape measure protein
MKQAKNFASAYGVSAKETAGLAADLAAAGYEGEKLQGALTQTTRLSVLGEVDRQEAMKTTLSLQSAFKMNTMDLTKSIDFLNAVENQTSTSLIDLTTALPKAAPVIRALGGDIEDFAVLMAALKEGGVPAAEAANAIKSGLSSLINPSKEAIDYLMKFGVDLPKLIEANSGHGKGFR